VLLQEPRIFSAEADRQPTPPSLAKFASEASCQVRARSGPPLCDAKPYAVSTPHEAHKGTTRFVKNPTREKSRTSKGRDRVVFVPGASSPEKRSPNGSARKAPTPAKIATPPGEVVGCWLFVVVQRITREVELVHKVINFRLCFEEGQWNPLPLHYKSL